MMSFIIISRQHPPLCPLATPPRPTVPALELPPAAAPRPAFAAHSHILLGKRKKFEEADSDA
jgi:hypothetical protein